MAANLRRTPLYAQAEKILEDLLVRGRYRIGDRIPPEAELMGSLGVSRATIRAAVGRLADRGLLVRRQGSGTFLAGLPEGGGQAGPVGIKLGSAVTELGRLETYASIAERLGLKTDVEQVRVSVAASSPEEADALELSAGHEVTRVSRVLLIDGAAAAWMLDVMPADVIPAGTVRQRLPTRPMLLDVLLDEGVPVAFSEVEVSAVLLGPEQDAGRGLRLGQPTAALQLTETMYLEAPQGEGRPVQWSRNLFLPGTFGLRLVREIAARRDPAVILQLLTEGGKP